MDDGRHVIAIAHQRCANKSQCKIAINAVSLFVGPTLYIICSLALGIECCLNIRPYSILIGSRNSCNVEVFSQLFWKSETILQAYCKSQDIGGPFSLGK
jgi:hypothetical protein